MKKTLKLLTLAMLFAMPLAACGNDQQKPADQGGQQQSGDDEGGGSHTGGGGDEGGGGGGGQQQSSTVTLDFSKLTSVSGKSGGVSYAADKNGGQSDPAIGSDGDLRIYAKGTFTLSASSNMTKAVFNISKKGLYRLADISASVGSVSYSSDNKVVTWTGNATKVVFTVGEKATHGTDGSSKAGQFDFNTVVISLGSGGGSGGGDEGGGTEVSDGEQFFKDVLEAIDGKEPVFDVDYWDDDGLWTYYEADDLEDDIDEIYDLLKDDFDCDEPEEYDGYYGFYVYSDDEMYYIDVYSYEDEDDGNLYVELDLWDLEDIDWDSIDWDSYDF